MAKLLIRYILFFINCILTFVSALCITLCAVLLIIMHDPVVLEYVETAVCTGASKAFECNFNAQVARIDLVRGTIFLTDVVVLPVQKRDWFWTSDNITIQVDWLKLLSKQVVLTISCGIMHIQTKLIDNKVAIEEHLKAFLQEKDLAIPIIPEKVYIPKAHITLHVNDDTAFECTLSGAIELIHNQQHIGFTVTQEDISYNGQPLARNMNISIKDRAEIHGVVSFYNPLDSSWVPGKIQANFTGLMPECSFVSDDQKTTVRVTKSAINATLAGIPLLLEYTLHDDYIALNISQDETRSLDARIYYNGRYTVDGSTDFFYNLLQKKVIPSVYAQPLAAYNDFLNLKAPFNVQGFKAGRYFQNSIALTNLQIRIPYTYNFLRELHTTVVYAPEKRSLILRDTHLQTDRGRLLSGIATLGFDEQNALAHAHVPIMVHDFFINRAKDFFAELSGACVVEYHKDTRSKIQGICTIKKCHIGNNPFSGGVGNDIVFATVNPLESHPLAQNTDLDITLHSYEPVDIKTPFLQARAHVEMQFLGTISQPQLYGQIELLQGALNFPYKPLEIRYGKIFFVDNERDDPAIELSASAVIKNYAITLFVEGTAQSPVITFQSTPHLQEEQIIALLFGGSPDSSLSLVMPLSSMGVVEKLIVGSRDEFAQDDTLKKWLRPLENVKIVPRFSDQTSRGGLRAALAIEANDYVSALIQQNFSLSEDVLIEVAYKPLDELTIRGMRDERGDFGGEVEARFTW